MDYQCMQCPFTTDSRTEANAHWHYEDHIVDGPWLDAE